MKQPYNPYGNIIECDRLFDYHTRFMLIAIRNILILETKVSKLNVENKKNASADRILEFDFGSKLAEALKPN